MTDKPDQKHGTSGNYRRGCRCDPCRDAYAKHRRDDRAKWRAMRGPVPAVHVSADESPGRKIKFGEVRERKVTSVYGSPALSVIMVGVLRVTPGDTVEITYGADEIVIRRAGETKREVVRGLYHGRPAMAQPGTVIGSSGGRNAIKFKNWWTYNGPTWAGHDNLTESQAIAWCLDGVLPTDGGEG